MGRKPTHWPVDLRKIALSTLMEDQPIKCAAYASGIPEKSLGKLINRMGIRRMMVTAEERTALLAARKAAS